MYTASAVCNIAQSHWLHPARWMYYHLLDGDWASNACSWQWVAGANSSKKYYANQENINKYTHTRQFNTFLDKPYEWFESPDCPKHLMDNQEASLKTILPEAAPLQVDQQLPTFVYNYYNLDPLWHAGEEGNRILLLEPEFFNNYPVSERCMDFMLALSKNIQNIQVYVGDFEQLCHQQGLKDIYYKENPLNIGYKGIEDSRDWMASQLTGYFPSFFAYWKKIEKLLYQQYRK
jgi:deoxyribodipyrimidine photo-lyase